VCWWLNCSCCSSRIFTVLLLWAGTAHILFRHIVILLSLITDRAQHAGHMQQYFGAMREHPSTLRSSSSGGHAYLQVGQGAYNIDDHVMHHVSATDLAGPWKGNTQSPPSPLSPFPTRRLPRGGIESLMGDGRGSMRAFLCYVIAWQMKVSLSVSAMFVDKYCHLRSIQNSGRSKATNAIMQPCLVVSGNACMVQTENLS